MSKNDAFDAGYDETNPILEVQRKEKAAEARANAAEQKEEAGCGCSGCIGPLIVGLWLIACPPIGIVLLILWLLLDPDKTGKNKW